MYKIISIDTPVSYTYLFGMDFKFLSSFVNFNTSIVLT
jgi:hypothetical protein